MARHRQVSNRPTLSSVAAEAGVSLSTASLVYSGKGPVAPETRKRVLAAAEHLGYLGPDPMASSLRTGRSGVVAVLTGSRLSAVFRDPFAVAQLDGLSTALDQADTGILLIPELQREPARVVARLATSAVDAVVVLGGIPTGSPVIAHLRARRIPVIVIGSSGDHDIVTIGIDNRTPMAVSAQHLWDLGHRRIGVISMPTGVTARMTPSPLGTLIAEATYLETRDRLQGIADVFGPDVPGVAPDDWDIESGRAAAEALLTVDPLPTALIALSDLLAMGAIAHAEEHGLAVPQDVSVTGFDGIPTPWWSGTLTTVAQPGVEKGVVAGKRLIDLIAGRSITDEVLPAEFRIGTSTARPPVG
jgi:DNA-binding LacI/PurR family transcriptional regulator